MKWEAKHKPMYAATKRLLAGIFRRGPVWWLLIAALYAATSRLV